jgi:hypothetical protein
MPLAELVPHGLLVERFLLSVQPSGFGAGLLDQDAHLLDHAR